MAKIRNYLGQFRAFLNVKHQQYFNILKRLLAKHHSTMKTNATTKLVDPIVGRVIMID